MFNCLVHICIYAVFILLLYKDKKSRIHSGKGGKDNGFDKKSFLGGMIITAAVSLIPEVIIYAVSGIINYLFPLLEGLVQGIQYAMPLMIIGITTVTAYYISRKAERNSKSIPTIVVSVVVAVICIIFKIMEKNINEEMLLSTSTDIIDSDATTLKILYVVSDVIMCIPMIAYIVDVWLSRDKKTKGRK